MWRAWRFRGEKGKGKGRIIIKTVIKILLGFKRKKKLRGSPDPAFNLPHPGRGEMIEMHNIYPWNLYSIFIRGIYYN